MRRAKTSWRDLGGLLVACVLALLVIAPTANASGCLCVGSVAASEVSALTVQGDTHGDKSPCDAACCLSGHCHQGAPMLNPLVTSVPTPVEIGTRPSSAATMRALGSLPVSGPDRPPRA